MADYLVPPTAVDYNNAMLYAQHKRNKAICLAHPDLYTWVPDKVVSYPCPTGLTCESGTCVFTETGCRAASTLDYFDCKRKVVDCEIPTRPDGKCEVCEFAINGYNFTPPVVPDGTLAPSTCGPGDVKYLQTTKSSNEDGTPIDASKLWCKGMTYDPEPYLIDGQPVSCTSDVDCGLTGAGGQCMLIPERKATNKCVDTGNGYLEWRKNYTQWEGAPAQDACVTNLTLFKKWCEMPWTRPPTKKEENLSVSLTDRIKLYPQVKMHPPFYYDDYSGRCYVTQPYCSNSIPDGGFHTSFGVSKEYLAGTFTSCTYPEGRKKHVQEGYDCCTPLGQSVGEFFIGRTLMSQYAELNSGELTFGQFMNQNGNAVHVGEFLSDERFKEVYRRYGTTPHPNVFTYEYSWRGIPQRRVGLLADEVERAYPGTTRVDVDGKRIIVPNAQRATTDGEYAQVMALGAALDAFYDAALAPKP